MASTMRSVAGTIRSWSSQSSFPTTESISQSKSTKTQSPGEIEKAGLRSSATSDFPWMAQEFEPIRAGAPSSSPQWFRDAKEINRNMSARSGRSGPSRRSSRSSLRRSFEDLGLIASDMDYYAGAVSDYLDADEHYGRSGEGGDQEDSDGENFGQIQIIRPIDVKSSSSEGERSDKKEFNLVTWDGPSDPENPKNWTRRRKWLATMTVSLLTFISPVSSSMIAPTLAQIKVDLDVPSELVVELALSVFVLGFAVGPLVLGPLSELFGRRRILLLSGLFYFVFNLSAGFSHNIGQVIAFRFLSGLGGSAPLGIGGGVLADIWMPQERGKAMALYSLMPLLGPALGPVAGGFIAQWSTWRWVFWSTSVVSILFITMGTIFLKETYAATILDGKKKRMIRATGNVNLRTEFDNPHRSLISHIGTALKRPFIMLFTQPIVQVLALYIGYVFGVLYLVLASFPQVWAERYNERPAIAGLNYFSLGIGFFLGAQLAARFADRIYKHLKAKNSDGNETKSGNGYGGAGGGSGGSAGHQPQPSPPQQQGRSEYRVPLMFPGAVMVPVGLLMYGWAAQARTHWIVPNIGAVIFAAGNQLVFQNCQIYLVDAYTRYAASAIAATAVLRSLGGFAFPLFAPAMYRALGYGWGNTTLALFGIVVGLPVPCLLWWYGETLRKKSTFAAG